MQYGPTAYRDLVTAPSANPIAEVWNKAACRTPSLWEMIKAEGDAFVLALEDGRVLPLASFADADLVPDLPSLSGMGDWAVKHSLAARILAARRGKEEVTFYCLLEQPHGKDMIDRGIDRKVIAEVAPPLAWRRLVVVEALRQGVLRALTAGQGNLTLLDIGCGGGFDGLDIMRILTGIHRAAPAGLTFPEHRIFNVDIDERWLATNRFIAESLYGQDSRTERRVTSAFDYLEGNQVAEDLNGVTDLVLSCNGFSDFFSDAELERLYRSLRAALDKATRSATAVLPIALSNTRQEMASRMIGFGYEGRPKAAIRKLVETIFAGYRISYKEAFSQAVFVVDRSI
jgi:SAM-dependent methyltransferase